MNGINGAFDVLAERSPKTGLSLESVMQLDYLFKDIMQLNALPPIIKERFLAAAWKILWFIYAKIRHNVFHLNTE